MEGREGDRESRPKNGGWGIGNFSSSSSPQSSVSDAPTFFLRSPPTTRCPHSDATRRTALTLGVKSDRETPAVDTEGGWTGTAKSHVGVPPCGSPLRWVSGPHGCPNRTGVEGVRHTTEWSDLSRRLHRDERTSGRGVPEPCPGSRQGPPCVRSRRGQSGRTTKRPMVRSAPRTCVSEPLWYTDGVGNHRTWS